jgi:Immunity protein 50
MSKSWPDIIDNPVYLESIYGNRPSLGPVEMTKIEFDRNGPTVRLNFLSKSLPQSPPKKWGSFNTVAFTVELFSVHKFDFGGFLSEGPTELTYETGKDGQKLVLKGASHGQFHFSYFSITHISGLTSGSEYL